MTLPLKRAAAAEGGTNAAKRARRSLSPEPAPEPAPAALTEPAPGPTPESALPAPRVDRVVLRFEARARDALHLLQRVQALLLWIRDSHLGHGAQPFPFTAAMATVVAHEQGRTAAEVEEVLHMFREVRDALHDARRCNARWRRAAVDLVDEAPRAEWFANLKQRLGTLQYNLSTRLERVYCRCSNNWHYMRTVARALHEQHAALAAVQALAPAPPFPLGAEPQQLWERAFAP
jgi:hypothetical protein